MSDWKAVPDNIDDYIGFVYLITCTVNGKSYIGKKLFKNNFKRKPLKGRINNRAATRDSDWQDYYGSCNELLVDINRYGKENFNRYILHCHKTRWEWSYAELKEQIDRDVLRDPMYYNGIIRVRLCGMKRKLVILEDE